MTLSTNVNAKNGMTHRPRMFLLSVAQVCRSFRRFVEHPMVIEYVHNKSRARLCDTAGLSLHYRRINTAPIRRRHRYLFHLVSHNQINSMLFFEFSVYSVW